MVKTYAIILASGTGNRFGSNLPKQFTKIEGKTILEYSIEAFEKSDLIDKIVLIIAPDYIDKARSIITSNKYKKVCKILAGGKTRKESSFIGINAISDTEANVLIHDCARPFVSQNIIASCVNALKSYNAITVGIPSTDTIIKVKDNIIEDIPNRSELIRVQTPQGFKLSLIKAAHELTKNDNSYTDDCGIIFRNKLAQIHVIEGCNQNIKITYPEDIIFAKEIIKNLH